jgi:hypothetical protein
MVDGIVRLTRPSSFNCRVMNRRQHDTIPQRANRRTLAKSVIAHGHVQNGYPHVRLRRWEQQRRLWLITVQPQHNSQVWLKHFLLFPFRRDWSYGYKGLADIPVLAARSLASSRSPNGRPKRLRGHIACSDSAARDKADLEPGLPEDTNPSSHSCRHAAEYSPIHYESRLPPNPNSFTKG